MKNGIGCIRAKILKIKNVNACKKEVVVLKYH